MAGYSGTPLVKKLGIKPASRVIFLGQPAAYTTTLGELPADLRQSDKLDGWFDLIQVFVNSKSELKTRFPRAVRHIPPDGVIWVSWPKRSSRVKTDLDENIVREIGLAAGLVDIKVCAVDDVWSGLKFVYRLKDRQRK